MVLGKFNVCVFSHSVMSNSLWPHELYSPSVSSVHGILQSRILEQVAIPNFRGFSQFRDQTHVFWVFSTGGPIDHYLTQYIKINSKWIKYLNLRPETLRFLEALSSSSFTTILSVNIRLAKKFTWIFSIRWYGKIWMNFWPILYHIYIYIYININIICLPRQEK